MARLAPFVARWVAPVVAGGLLSFGVTSSVGQQGVAVTLSVRLAGETKTTVTIAWSPVEADGFAFYRDGARVSHTLNGTRTSVTFGKPDSRPHTYSVAVVTIQPKQTVTVPAPPPSSQLTALAQNVLFTAWNPNAALRAPPRYRVAISADPYFDAAARAGAGQARAAGHLVAVWGNQEQIGAQRIRDLCAAVACDYLIFQAETQFEYASAIAAGAQLIVGNPNAWTSAQRADAATRINAGQLALIFETYTNDGGPWPAGASSQGVPAASLCLGVGWGQNPYQLADYQPRTPSSAWPTMSVYLAEDMAESSWQQLPA